MTSEEKNIRTFLSTYPGYLKKSNKKTLRKLKLGDEFTHLVIQIKKELRPTYYPSKFNSPTNHTAKILVFDIETAPLISYHWRHWKQNIYSEQRIEDNWPILTWSAKWLFEDKMYSMKMTPSEAIKRDDKRVVEGLWRMIEEADILIAHHGLKFDIPMMNGRFLLHNLPPPSSYLVVDTKNHLKRIVSLPSYKLDDLCKYFGLEGKIKTDFSWWTKFMEGDPEAIDKMQEYNDKDVYQLEELYLHIRPWLKPHPNLSLFSINGSQCCPSCSSTKATEIGNYNTYVNSYPEYRCDDCGHNYRGRKTNTPIGGVKTVSVSLAK